LAESVALFEAEFYFLRRILKYTGARQEKNCNQKTSTVIQSLIFSPNGYLGFIILTINSHVGREESGHVADDSCLHGQ
jgi:hypothetical protein